VLYSKHHHSLAHFPEVRAIIKMASFAGTLTDPSDDNSTPNIPKAVDTDNGFGWRHTQFPCGRYGVCCVRIQPHATKGNLIIYLRSKSCKREIYLLTGSGYSTSGKGEKLVPMCGHKKPWHSWYESEYVDVKFDPVSGKFWVEDGDVGWEHPRKTRPAESWTFYIMRTYDCDPHNVAKIVSYDDGWSNSMIFVLLRIRTLLLVRRAELSDSISSSSINCICSHASLWFFQRVCSFLLCIGSH